MKAIVYTKYGSPDVLQLKEVANPTDIRGSLLLIKSLIEQDKFKAVIECRA